MLNLILDEGGTGQRVGVFFIATAFTLAQLGTNIAANSVSAGTDMTALFPKYLNIRRGSYICACIGICIVPWNLLDSSNSFTTYLSAYSVFLSSIAGPIIADYYVVRKGYLNILDLYSAQNTGTYWYTWGINWRAYAAYISGILINIVGFVGVVRGEGSVPAGAVYIYNVSHISNYSRIMSKLTALPGQLLHRLHRLIPRLLGSVGRLPRAWHKPDVARSR